MQVEFGALLASVAYRLPDGSATTFLDRRQTWGEVHNHCQRVASAFAELGLMPGDRIAYLGFNSDILFNLFFAPSMAGLELIVMNFRWSVAECKSALEDCGPKALIFDPDHAELAMAAVRDLPSPQHLIQTDGTPPPGALRYAELSQAPLKNGLTASGGDDTLVIYFTGGTTGRSKGVMISHNNMLANALGSPPLLRCTPDRTQIVIGPLFHMAPGARLYSAPLLNAHSVIMPRFDLVEMMRLIERHRVHAVTMVPTMLHMLLEHPDFASYDLSSLGPIMLGGAPTPPDLLDRAMAAFPQAEFTNGYGMTEMSNLIAALPPENHVLEGPNAGKLQSVGKPVPYLDLRLVDECDRPVPQGTVGEIVARGPTVMKGYLNRPDETKEALRGGWFHTGDLGFFDVDGFLTISGRAKDMIITGGENVYPTEVEDVLCSHPDVSQVAVIGIPDPKWGEAVHAIVILTDSATGSADTLIAHCRATLAGYKVPRSITFRTEPMPLSGANKILKTELRKPFLA